MSFDERMKTDPAVQQDQNRADFLEYLYELYGRGNRGVDNCFTYTGLFQQHVALVGAEAARDQVSRFHEVGAASHGGDVELPAQA